MKKIFYNSNGWVCNRYPNDIPIDDENRYIEVSDEEYDESMGTATWYAWRVVSDKLINEVYTDLTEEQKLEKQRYLIEEEIFDKKNYLAETDYVITKINEAQALSNNDEIAQLKSDYADILVKRKECRQRINELEGKL